MKKPTLIVVMCLCVIYLSCEKKVESKAEIEEKIIVTDELQDYFGITNKDKLSAASKRGIGSSMNSPRM